MEAHAIAGPHGGLQTLDYVLVGAYLLVTLGIVLWSLRRQASTDDFFLGGRRMPWLAVGLSLMATLMSTISYLGTPGEVIQNGFAFSVGVQLAIPFSMAVVLVLWIPFFMRLRLTSAYDYLEKRFDRRARLLAATFFVVLRMGWMSLVVYTGSLALSQMTEVPVQWIVGSVGVAATVYACIGGMSAIIWTDVLQFLMLLGGTLIAIGYVLLATGTGPTHWWAIVSAHTTHHTSPPLVSLDPTVRMTIITATINSFFFTICTHGSDQVVLQRYFSTTSLAAARRSFIVNVIADQAVMALLALTGLALLSFYLEHPGFLPAQLSPTVGADKIMPYFFSHQLPVGLGGLILASFLCDAMQTLDSGVNCITAVASTHTFARFSRRGLPSWSRLALARVLTLVIGLIVTLLAFGLALHAQHSGRNIVDMIPRSYSMFTGPLAALFFIGMFLPRCTSRSALPAVGCGLVISVVWTYWKELFGGEHHLTVTMAIAVPCVAALVAAFVLGWVLEPGGYHPGRDWVWRAVMQRPVPADAPQPYDIETKVSS